MRQVRLKADSIRPRPADAVGAHKSGLVRRAGDGFAGFGEERKAALRALGGAYRVGRRRAEDGDGREAGSACRTPRMRQVRLKADSIRFKSPAVIPLSSTEDWYSRKNRLVSFSTSARFTCTPFVSFISSFKEATIFFKCSFSRRIALSVAFSSASFMEYLLTNQHSPVKNFLLAKG